MPTTPSNSRERGLAALAPEDRKTLDAVARAHVQNVLAACHGNQSDAARALGLDRKTLARRMRKWGIPNVAAPRTLGPSALVAIEGIDGSGITTQAKRLVEFLQSKGHRAVLTSEPSTGEIGVLIRKLLASGLSLTEPGTLHMMSLLFAADRIDHFRTEVGPALARGLSVVSDRWYHSSLAYQRTGIERDWIIALNRHTRIPDVTIFLDVDPEVAHERRAKLGRSQELFHQLETQREVADGYRISIAELRADGERIEIVDGERSPDAVFASILETLGFSPAQRRR